MASPQSTLPNKQDDDLNPGNKTQDLFDAEKRAAYTSAGTDQLESFANDPNNATGALKDAEEDPNLPVKDGFYRPTGGGAQQKVTFKSLLKKRGPLGAIVAAVLGGGGLLSVLLAPGLGLVQLKEIMLGDLNDQLAAFDIRSDAMWRAKLGGLSSGVCSNQVKIRCQFSTMSKRQIEKFRAAGFQLDEVRDGAFGRQRIVSMTAPNGAAINNPQDLLNLRRDPTVRSALNRVFNPIYASLSDSVANKVFGDRFKTGKTTKLVGGSTAELDESLAKNTTGEIPDGNRPMLQDDSGRYIFDEDGKRVDEGTDRFNQILEADENGNTILERRAAQTAETGTKAVSGVLGGALKGASLIGAVDSACSVYNAARAVAAAAKAARSIQLAQYSMVFLTTADEIKAGTATPESVEYLGNILTATDTRQLITDELSPLPDDVGNIDAAQNLAGEGELRRENPFYGKNAFDSPGYAVAAYNDAPTLTTRSQQYMVGGGLTGTLSSVTDQVVETVSPGNPAGVRDTCGVIQSWWVRGVGLALGVAAAIGSFGVTTVLSVGGSLAVSLALPFLEAALADIVAGQVVGPGTKGVEAGDAVFAGTGALLGGMAQARGLKPLESSELESYLATSKNIENQYIAQARFEAQAAPFDIMNQSSFLGSFARSLNIPLTKAASSVNGTLQSIPAILSTSLASIVPNAKAQQAFNPERFNKCEDVGYDELGIAADVFCNVRYGLTQSDIGKDSIAVVEYMLGGGYVDQNGIPRTGSLYDIYIEKCVDRQDGWGETGVESPSDWDTGKACMGKSSLVSAEQLSNFRVYTIDKSISDAMDGETPTETETATATRPAEAIDKGRGWGLANGVDYSKYECDSRTTDLGFYTDPNYDYTVRLCKINFNSGSYESTVSSVISTSTMNMFEAAKKDGVELGISDGMRKYGDQYYSAYTEHKYGTAIDLGTPVAGQTICFAGVPSTRTGWGSQQNAINACKRIGGAQYAAYEWLNTNAANYGFYNLLTEPWHWSTSGG